LKYLEFEERVDSGKKLVEAEASPSFLVSIHRSLVPPTALGLLVALGEGSWKSKEFTQHLLCVLLKNTLGLPKKSGKS
jgi:hypothetical protein